MAKVCRRCGKQCSDNLIVCSACGQNLGVALTPVVKTNKNKWKNQKIIVTVFSIVFLSIFFVTCKGIFFDNAARKIVGRWVITSEMENTLIMRNNWGVSDRNFKIERITFFKDGTFEYESYGTVNSGQYEFINDGDKMHLVFYDSIGEYYEGDLSYWIGGDKLELQYYSLHNECHMVILEKD